MSKIFNVSESPKPNVKRNTFDMSFSNNLSMQIGKIYPIFCKEVIPGDSVDIDLSYGLRFMPLAFPTQTKMRLITQFFKVRNRNLWKGWQNFITKTGSQEQFPYIRNKNLFKTGSLGDYLGLPTTVVSESQSQLQPGYLVNSDATIEKYNNISVGYGSGSIDTTKQDQYILYQYVKPPQRLKVGDIIQLTLHTNVIGDIDQFFRCVPVASTVTTHTSGPNQGTSIKLSNFITDKFTVTNEPFKVGNRVAYKLSFQIKEDISDIEVLFFGVQVTDVQSFNQANVAESLEQMYYRYTSNDNDFQPSPTYLTYESADISVNSYYIFPPYVSNSNLRNYYNVIGTKEDFGGALIDGSDYSGSLRISALPFRAYESIYNAFFREDRNNPYIVDGIAEPNVYLPTTSGGLDTNEYVLHRANWEQDFLTTAVASPQLATTPLVGISSLGTGTFVSEDGSSHDVQFLTSDGDHISSVDFPSNVPSDVRRAAVKLATQGISINDFRNVNAFQRWLESNVRRGLKYRNQIEGHFGITPSYAELDMPEFIGGTSTPVDIQQINQTSASTDLDPLGSYAGQAFVVGTAQNKIREFCDEHGFIIGVAYVVPTPIYSQLLPKHFLKFDTLDYFFPEFGHIGLQPIKYSEVAPLQSNYEGVPLSDTYGYQRAYYDYLSSVDEVHGDFRTTLRDFVLMRHFKSVPSLTEDFLTISEDQLNDIFTVNDVNGTPIDHILGTFHFDAVFKRPIPRFGIPRLE